MIKLIKANTNIPTKKSEVFSTALDNQRSVEVNIYEGEKPLALENRLLGRIVLDDLETAPREVPQIEISFDIDANGTFHVSVKDKGSGKEKRLLVKTASHLTEEELARRIASIRHY